MWNRARPPRRQRKRETGLLVLHHDADQFRVDLGPQWLGFFSFNTELQHNILSTIICFCYVSPLRLASKRGGGILVFGRWSVGRLGRFINRVENGSAATKEKGKATSSRCLRAIELLKGTI